MSNIRSYKSRERIQTDSLQDRDSMKFIGSQGPKLRLQLIMRSGQTMFTLPEMMKSHGFQVLIAFKAHTIETKDHKDYPMFEALEVKEVSLVTK